MGSYKVWLQYILPQHFLSGLMFALTRWRWRPWKNLLIKSFIKCYRVDMTIAERADVDGFSCFNDFFTRALKPEARLVDRRVDSLVSPADAVVSAVGRIDGETLYQAKGKQYSLNALLACDRGLVEEYANGRFITLYLSPRDYHRVHLPVGGGLESMIYVPGCLFSVNENSVRHVDNLFARNERVICNFSTEAGKLAMIMVGAVFVGSMDTVWQGQITPPDERRIRRWFYSGSPVLAKGEEMGRFNMGSTVIVLMGDNVDWDEEIQAGKWVAMGSRIGRVGLVPPPKQASPPLAPPQGGSYSCR